MTDMLYAFIICLLGSVAAMVAIFFGLLRDRV